MLSSNHTQPSSSIIETSRRFALRSWLKPLLLSTTLIPMLSAHAIITRHDKADEAYLEQAKPFEASVAFLDRCVATVLSDHWLITAKHCVSIKNQYPVSIRHMGEQYPVAEIVEHPKAAELDDLDMALLKLHWPLKNAEPVSLYAKDDELQQQVTFVGNGMTGTGLSGDSVDDKKLRAATNTVSLVEANWLSFTFDQGESATEYEGVSGKGDSGGPALIKTPTGFALVGVGCCQDPVVTDSGEALQGGYQSTEYYSRVSPHVKWINKHLKANSTRQVYSPILTTMESGNYDTVKRLLRANTSWLTNPDLVNEIVLNSFYRSEDMSRFLIEEFDALHAHLINGLPLPVYAYLQGNGKVFSLLVEQGVSLDFKGFRNQALPSLISWQYFGDDYPQLMRQLLSSGFDVNAVDDRGDSALHMAVFFDSPQRVEFLLSLGADVHLADKRGNTALIDAARIGNKQMVNVLLQYGANATHVNQQQQTAVDVANAMGHKRIAKQLTDYQHQARM